MSRDAKVGPLPWVDGEYTWRLGWAQLIELQEQCDAGPFVVLDRLSRNSWRVQDISHTLRLGLVGGGTPPADALKLVQRYVESRPPLENLMMARAVLMVALHGAGDEAPGEDQGVAAENDTTTSPTESSE